MKSSLVTIYFRFFSICIFAVFLSGCAISPLGSVPRNVRPVPSPKLPKEPFAWGFSSSSYQYEDPAVQPGEPAYFQTDWDLLIAQGKAPKKGNALFSWSHFDKDVAALKKAGVTHYRFSIEWARVEPQPGKYNETAIRGYVTMARKLRAAGIEPVVCLWHFTFPAWLTDANHPKATNWLHPLAAKRWALYVQKMVHATKPYVRYYAPQNEPNGQIATAYLTGMWPPCMTASFSTYKKAVTASVAMFRSAATIIKKERPDAIVMSVEALPWWKNGWADPFGIIYETMLHQNYDHLDGIYDVCDIMGINYYYTQSAGVVALLSMNSRRGPNFSMMGWDINPQGLYDQIRTVSTRYGRAVMITENGIATRNDAKRIEYIAGHLNKIREAMRDGYPVRGYLGWSLADNYEWHYGYDATFGLSHMNPKTLEREPKDSFFFYRNTIAYARRHGTVPAIELSTPDKHPTVKSCH